MFLKWVFHLGTYNDLPIVLKMCISVTTVWKYLAFIHCLLSHGILRTPVPKISVAHCPWGKKAWIHFFLYFILLSDNLTNILLLTCHDGWYRIVCMSENLGKPFSHNYFSCSSNFFLIEYCWFLKFPIKLIV